MSVLLAHSGLMLMQNMAAIYEIFSMTMRPINELMNKYYFCFLTTKCRSYVMEYTCETVSAYRL